MSTWNGQSISGGNLSEKSISVAATYIAYSSLKVSAFFHSHGKIQPW